MYILYRFVVLYYKTRVARNYITSRVSFVADHEAMLQGCFVPWRLSIGWLKIFLKIFCILEVFSSRRLIALSGQLEEVNSINTLNLFLALEDPLYLANPPLCTMWMDTFLIHICSPSSTPMLHHFEQLTPKTSKDSLTESNVWTFEKKKKPLTNVTLSRSRLAS